MAVLGDIWKECFLDGMDSSMEGLCGEGRYFVNFPKALFKGDFPSDNFSSGTVSNVPFPRLQ